MTDGCSSSDAVPTTVHFDLQQPRERLQDNRNNGSNNNRNSRSSRTIEQSPHRKKASESPSPPHLSRNRSTSAVRCTMRKATSISSLLLCVLLANLYSPCVARTFLPHGRAKAPITLSGGAATVGPKQQAVVVNQKTGDAAATDESTKKVLGIPSTSRLERLLNRIYDNADTNSDGNINFTETYELVLQMYVSLNRKAPIPPPSRKKVMQLFLKYDVDTSNEISKDEFQGLAKELARRALSRLIAHKLVTLIGAPLLAEFVIRRLAGKAWPKRLVSFLIPKRFHERILPMVTSPAFGRTLLLILLISFLGNIVMSTVNWVLDMSLPQVDEFDEPTQRRIKKIERRR